MPRDDDYKSPKGRLLKRLIESGIQERDRRFGKVAKELDIYDYSDKTPWEVTWDESLSWYTKIHVTQQFKREIGSRLYNQNPIFRAEAQEWSTPDSQVRANVVEALLNYARNENDFHD